MNSQMKGAALGLALVVSSPVWADDVPAPAADAKSHATWEGDFDKAVEQAKKEKKDLLVDFTGSKWCGWCIKLHEEVFSHDEFTSAATKQYVLVSLDFDQQGQATAECPNPARANELEQKHQIHSFPTILLMTPEGEVFGSTGYKPGGPEKYVEHLAKLRAAGLPALTTAKAILAEYAAAKDGDKAAVYEKAAAALSALEPGAATAGMLSAPVKAAYDSDPENKSGLRVKAAKALLKTATADPSVVAEAEKLDPKNEQGLYEFALFGKVQQVNSAEAAKAAFAEIEALFAAGGPKDKLMKKQLAISGMSFGGHPKVMNDPAKAKEYAKRVRECGYDEGDEGLKKYVDKLLGDETK